MTKVITEPNPYTEQVQRGVALLDKHKPGWRDVVVQAIANDNLHMDSCSLCVLGHVYAGAPGAGSNPFCEGMSRLADDGGQYYFAHEIGFDIDIELAGSRDEEDNWYALLAVAWREELGITP